MHLHAAAKGAWMPTLESQPYKKLRMRRSPTLQPPPLSTWHARSSEEIVSCFLPSPRRLCRGVPEWSLKRAERILPKRKPIQQPFWPYHKRGGVAAARAFVRRTHPFGSRKSRKMKTRPYSGLRKKMKNAAEYTIPGPKSVHLNTSTHVAVPVASNLRNHLQHRFLRLSYHLSGPSLVCVNRHRHESEGGDLPLPRARVSAQLLSGSSRLPRHQLSLLQQPHPMPR